VNRLGRHILSEIAGENQFIPNNYFVYNYIDEYDNAFESNETQMINKNHSNKIVLLSGPNFSGKSIYLKQVLHPFTILISRLD
jgi:Mismatch repair ATPase (MutS family)